MQQKYSYDGRSSVVSSSTRPIPLALTLLAERGGELARVHCPLDEQPHRLGAGTAVRHPLDVGAWVDADVCEDACDLNVVWGTQPGNSEALAAQVTDRPDALVADDLLAADVAPSDEDDGGAPIDLGNERCGVAEPEVRGARCKRLVILELVRRLLHVGDV